jgi:hypothetical protein
MITAIFVVCYGAILAALATLLRWEVKKLGAISPNMGRAAARKPSALDSAKKAASVHV